MVSALFFVTAWWSGCRCCPVASSRQPAAGAALARLLEVGPRACHALEPNPHGAENRNWVGCPHSHCPRSMWNACGRSVSEAGCLPGLLVQDALGARSLKARELRFTPPYSISPDHQPHKSHGHAHPAISLARPFTPSPNATNPQHPKRTEILHSASRIESLRCMTRLLTAWMCGF
jgi:hypothetical protein